MSTVKLVLGTSAATALAVAALAGCAKTTGSAAAAPASSSPAASAAATASAAASAAASGASSGGGGTSASGTACTTSDLSLEVIQGAQTQPGTTGSFYIQLANTSAQTCTLYGYPGVDLANSSGASLGMKDDWTVKNAMSGGESVQTLAPNAASAAYVTYPTAPSSQTTGDPVAVEVRV